MEKATEPKELTSLFEHSGRQWDEERTSFLIKFVVLTDQYLQVFSFPSADGLDNMKSNLHTLYKEATEELRKRGIKY